MVTSRFSSKRSSANSTKAWIALNYILCASLLLICMVSPAMGNEGGSREAQGDPQLLASLKPQERTWLKEHPVIRVGGPKSFPPFHYYDEQSRVSGMGPEYIAIIMKKLGVKVRYEKPTAWPEVLNKIKTGQLDIIACSAKSPDREAFLNFSRPYLSFPLVIITQKDAPFVGGLQDLHGKRVALIKKVVTKEWLQRDGLEVDALPVATPLKALQAVSAGRAEAAIENLAAASYLMHKHGLVNLKVAAPTDWGEYELYFAVRKDWPVLASIINKALADIPAEQQSGIRHKWITVRYELGVAPEEIAKWAAIAALPVALFILCMLVYNSRLRKEIVRRRQAEQEREKVIQDLQNALLNVKQLKGLLPICSSCKKIRDDQGYWQQVEEYVTQHSEAEFSHGICPQCMEKLYPETYERMKQKKEAPGKSN
jgi:ABC-type amino acid transport substrate-binding protein